MKSDGKRSFLSAAASRVSEALSNARTAVYDFFTVKMWSTELHKMNGLRKRAVKIVRVMALVFVGFQKDECSLHASSLTFISMLSLVPVLALGLSLARVSGYSETMRTEAKAFVRDMVADVSVPAAAGDAERTAVQAPPAGVITVERVEKLIDTVFSQKRPDTGTPVIPGARHTHLPLCFHPHGAELIHHKRAAIHPHPCLPKNHRAGGRKPHCCRCRHQDRAEKHQRRQCAKNIKATLE